MWLDQPEGEAAEERAGVVQSDRGGAWQGEEGGAEGRGQWGDTAGTRGHSAMLDIGAQGGLLLSTGRDKAYLLQFADSSSEAVLVQDLKLFQYTLMRVF